LVIRSRDRSKISASEASPMSTSSLTVRRATVLALGPENQPVSTGYLAGCCVHQVGTVALEKRNVRLARLRPPRLAHHFVVNRRRILTTLPKPISVLAAAFSRTAGIAQCKGAGPGQFGRVITLDHSLDCLAQLTVLPIGKMRLKEFGDR